MVSPPRSPRRTVRRLTDIAFIEAMLAGMTAALIGEVFFAANPVRLLVVAGLDVSFALIALNAYLRGARAWRKGYPAPALVLTLLPLPFTLVLASLEVMNAGFASPCYSRFACPYVLSIPFVGHALAAFLFLLATILSLAVATFTLTTVGRVPRPSRRDREIA